MKKMIFCFIIFFAVFPIFAQLNDVYVASTGGYWKNGKFVRLGTGTETNITQVIVNGSDVYAAGTEYSGYKDGFPTILIATYWKNGVAVRLTDENGVAEANGICVVGNDIYVAGREFDKNTGLYVLKYWKNGLSVNLTNGSDEAAVTGICTNGTDVYIVGNEYCGDMTTKMLTNGLKDKNSVAKYWKNGSEVILTDGGHPAYATSICVEGNDVYVCGQESDGAENIRYFGGVVVGERNQVAKYWKNGKGINLSDGTHSAMATSIFVKDGDVYIAGQEFKRNTVGLYDNFATYWKNGKAVNLTDGKNTAKAEAIFVVENLYGPLSIFLKHGNIT